MKTIDTELYQKKMAVNYPNDMGVSPYKPAPGEIKAIESQIDILRDRKNFLPKQIDMLRRELDNLPRQIQGLEKQLSALRSANR